MDIVEFEDVRPTVISAIIVMNISLNVLAIVVIARYPQLREDRTTLFMLSLMLSDLANGCTAMPISAAVCSRVTPTVREDNVYFSRIHALFSVGFTVTSVYSLSGMTICKMVAITNPLRYEQVLTLKRCYFIICGLWCIGALVGATSAYYVQYWNGVVCIYAIILSKSNTGIFMFFIIAALLCPVVGLVYSTTRIFLAIHRIHRQITAQVISVGGENSHVGTIPSMTLKSIRSGKNVLIVCLAFVVLTIPYDVQAILGVFELNECMPLWYMFAATWMFACNTFINSMIYLVVFRSVRKRTVEMFRAVCQC